MYSLQWAVCTVYSVQCTVSSVYSAHCTMYQYTVYSETAPVASFMIASWQGETGQVNTEHTFPTRNNKSYPLVFVYFSFKTPTATCFLPYYMWAYFGCKHYHVLRFLYIFFFNYKFSQRCWTKYQPKDYKTIWDLFLNYKSIYFEI